MCVDTQYIDDVCKNTDRPPPRPWEWLRRIPVASSFSTRPATYLIRLFAFGDVLFAYIMATSCKQPLARGGMDAVIVTTYATQATQSLALDVHAFKGFDPADPPARGAGAPAGRQERAGVRSAHRE